MGRLHFCRVTTRESLLRGSIRGDSSWVPCNQCCQGNGSVPRTYDFLNFRRNKVCLKWNCDRPSDENSQFEDHMWRKPKHDDRNTTHKLGDEVNDGEDDGYLDALGWGEETCYQQEEGNGI